MHVHVGMKNSYSICIADFLLGHNVGIKVSQSQESIMVQQVVDNILEFFWILSMRESAIPKLVHYLGQFC